MTTTQQILIITGPTATGKTSLATGIAKRIPSLLISADSRQVYKGMDVVTGKDHPKGVYIAGIDILYPDEEISVAVWLKYTQSIINKSRNKKLLPIIVGGTGLYLKSLTKTIETIGIPPNKVLRKTLSNQSLNNLQNQLKKLSPKKLSSMNNSDRNNPRRLIRAIEVELSPLSPAHNPPLLPTDCYTLTIIPPANHKEIITKRVTTRLLNDRAIKETRRLLSKYPTSSQSFTGIGYSSIIKYLQGPLSYREMQDQWIKSELAYAKSQLTWLRSLPNLHRITTSQAGNIPQVVKQIKTWYHEK